MFQYLEQVTYLGQSGFKKVVRNNLHNTRPIFVVSWDPSFPLFQPLHEDTGAVWNEMKEVFPEPPLIAYKQQKDIRDHIVQAKVSPNISHTKRKSGVWKDALSNFMFTLI